MNSVSPWTRMGLVKLAMLSLMILVVPDAAGAKRVRDGLVLLYDFQESEGRIVHDRSGVAPRIDLTIVDPSQVRWAKGELRLIGPTLIRSQSKDSANLRDLLRRSAAITIEAWIQPDERKQSGPARIVTFSKNASERNFTLGQDGDGYDVRMRTTRTNRNGHPSLSKSGVVDGRLTHLVYTRNREGAARLYINSKLIAKQDRAGDFGNWIPATFALGDELTGDRAWRGRYQLVALYSRPLSQTQIKQNFNSGPQGNAESKRDPTELFRHAIAPLLARRCVTCHDKSQRRGGLDLSTEEGLLRGGDSGPAIVSKQAGSSRLWKHVSSNKMPQEGKPLTQAQKNTLKEWITSGAVWAGELLDPNDYRNCDDGRRWIQRLTTEEYIATVQATLEVDIAREARKSLPADIRADGFRNTAYNLTVDLEHIEIYGKLAEKIVIQMNPAEFAKRFGGRGRLDVDDFRKMVAKMGKWVLRGPLNDSEVGAFAQIAVSVADNGGTYKEAVGYVLEAMLQSPRFLYRMEDHSMESVEAYELASRLSYILWGASPDEELMRAADRGELYDHNKLRRQIERMLKDPRAVSRSLQFAEQWLHLNRLDTLQPNRVHFPHWNRQLAKDMRTETLQFFEEVCWRQGRPMSDLFNAQVSFMTPELARHYNLPAAVRAPQPVGLQKVDLRNMASRGGLLTHGSILTVGGDEASMVSRGLFVLQDVLRGSVSDPPPCVDTTPVPTEKGLTQRGIAETRIANPNCGGCHRRFEPLAFGLERFDGLGAYSKRDQYGNPLREDGVVQLPGTGESHKYQSVSQMMNLLAASDRVQECITWKVAQFALGRPLVSEDVPELKQIHRNAWRSGGRYSDIATAVIMSELVRRRRTAQETSTGCP